MKPLRPFLRLLAAAVLCAIVPAAHAAPPPVQTTTFKSAAKRATFVELFSSEAKKGSPAADKWLSGLQSDERLWKTLVPVLFAVDSSKPGWRDRYADTENAARLSAYRANWGVEHAYVPAVVVNGVEWSGWAREEAIPMPPTPDAGVLTAVKASTEEVTVAFEPADKAFRDWTAHAALVGYGIVSKIGGGENLGKTTRRDFVSLRVSRKDLEEKRGVFKATLKLAFKTDAPTNGLGLVVWITRGENPVPVQAVGGIVKPPLLKKS